MVKVENISIGKGEYVYDISLDGSVVNALGMNILSNTDGFNFQTPNTFEFTNTNPYIGKGLNREVKEGKEYTGVEGDVAEFNDLYMRLWNGLGIDEYCTSTINLSRKNYADLMDDDSIKLVGNTIKSKKLPIYIEKFLDKGIRMLLNGKGYDFINFYYDYIEKIYNYKIPLKEIASIGKIKIPLNEYIENCNTLTKGGTKKASQAWYELVIKNHISLNMGESIYYINTGKKKNDSDVQRKTIYYTIENGEKIDITKTIDKEYNNYKKSNSGLSKIEFIKKNYPKVKEEDVINFNCELIPLNILNDEETEHFCYEGLTYNVDKYIEAFNKRIRPLLVCYKKDIRTTINDKGKEVDNMLITNPNDRKYFTQEDCVLISGEPYKSIDQDTLEQLMTIEDKEISFWLSVDKIPPYIEECGIDWSEVTKDYISRLDYLENDEIKLEVEKYNSIIEKITLSDVNSFNLDGELPKSILDICTLNEVNNTFISKKYNVVIGSIYDIVDKEFFDTDDDNEDTDTVVADLF